VTGGAGFIGSHLVEKLVDEGFETRVLDNFSSGNIENLERVKNDIELVNGDVRDVDVVSKTVNGVNKVIHLAALIDVNESLRKPQLYHDVNSTGTLTILNSARLSAKKFIFTSSAAVYGNPVSLPVKENHQLNPLSPYAASKLSAEKYCQAYSESFESKTTIFRLFNVYGPRQSQSNYSAVATAFINKAKIGEPPIIFGDGEQTRDFIFVEDVVQLIIRSIQSDASGVFNVGTGSAISINQLAEIVQKTSNGGLLKPVYADPRPGEIIHSLADVSKMVETFKFSPEVSLEDGLRKIIDANN